MNIEWKKSTLLRYLIILVLLLPVILARFVDYFHIPSPLKNMTIKVVKIPKGASIESIADTLLSKELIKHKKTFLFWAKTLDLDRSLKAGYFEIPVDLNYPQLVKFLTSARNKEIRVTLHEGWRISQIAAELHQQLNINPEKFKSLCYDRQVLGQLGIEAQSAEGYLLPDTYYFYWDMDETEIINMLVKQCQQIFSDSVQIQLNRINFTRHQILTLASIIEGEAVFDDERATISSVYHNRLRHKIKLQADPTIQYILQDSPRRLLLKDLAIDSPYNTYMYYGLPPGPINNPGKKSIMAAIYPRQTEYLYFVARGDGRHTFTRTAAEHAEEKLKFDRIRHEIYQRNRTLNLSR
jgi:UPF0755 protein